MKYSIDQIENKAVTAVKSLLDDESSLETEIETLDKKPFIDGRINIYNINQGESKVKNKFKGAINLQVKGTTNEKVLKYNKYSVSRIDLEGYYSMQGCFYFVVYISEDLIKVFYRDLQLYDIKQILETNTSESITLSFQEFPRETLEIRKLIHNSLLHQQNQNKNVLGIDLEKLNNETFTIKFYGDENDLSDVMKNGTYTYLTTPEGINIPSGKIQLNSEDFFRIQNIILENGNKIELASHKVSKNNTILVFDNYLELIFYDQKVTLNIKFNRAKNLERLIFAIDNVENILTKGFSIDGRHLNILKYFKDTTIIQELHSLKEFKNYITNVEKLLSILKVDTSFNYFELKDIEKQKLNSLLNLFEEKNKNGLFDMEFNKRYYIFIKNESIKGNLFYLKNVLSVQLDYEGRGRVTIFPSLIATENLAKLYDFSVENIKEDIYELYIVNDNHKDTNIFVNNYLLILLKNYDKSGKSDLLDLCLYVADILVEKEPTNISMLNYIQVIKRKRKLNSFEILNLKNIKETANNLTEKIGAKILLEDSDVEVLINKLGEDERESLYTYPIMNFHK